MLTTIIVSVFASTGFWSVITLLIQKVGGGKNSRDKILMGLASRQIQLDAEVHLARGYITRDDYHIMADLLYEPYKALGGNGGIKKLMDEIDKLPLREV